MKSDVPLPARMAHLPVDARGYVVPFFVAYIDGKPDHRVVDPRKLHACITRRLCWVCGNPLGREMAFVAGPMCGVNRTSSEPPQHPECSLYSVRACPFLSRPHMHRREAGRPPVTQTAGLMLEHNPGVSLIWITKSFKLTRPRIGNTNGMLFALGEPERIEFWKEGRTATRAEIDESLELGLTMLAEYVKPDEELDFKIAIVKFRLLLPPSEGDS